MWVVEHLLMAFIMYIPRHTGCFTLETGCPFWSENGRVVNDTPSDFILPWRRTIEMLWEGRQWKLRRSERIELWRIGKRRLSGLVVRRTIFPSLLLICTNCTSKIRNGTWKISVEGNKNCIITLRLSDFRRHESRRLFLCYNESLFLFSCPSCSKAG